ncbi:MAG: hypothetical protein ACRDFS_01075 [Chloroflexota bacterium]
MPKLERLEWLAPLSEGRGVTLSDDPEADLFLQQNAFALLLGVLTDSQFATRRAFAIPYKLRERLGHLDVDRLAVEGDAVQEAFAQKPALHRFPNKFAALTRQLAEAVLECYGGETSLLWDQASDVQNLASRLMELPSFGVEKTNWTIGMLGCLGMLPFEEWEGYRVKNKPAKAKSKATARGQGSSSQP